MLPHSEMDDFGHVVASFTVVAATPIDGLEQHAREPQPATDEFVYDFGSVKIDESDSGLRADALDSTINGFVDCIDVIPRPVLHQPGTLVRLYLSFGQGAETISSETVKRLADVNAVLWIDV